MAALFFFNNPFSGATAQAGLPLFGTHSNGIPNSGTRILRSGQGVTFAQTGAPQATALTLTTLTLSFQNTSANTYRLEVLGDPAQKLGPRFVVPGALLTMPPGNDSVSAAGLAIPMPAGVELGLRVVRILGGGSIGGDVFAFAGFA